MPFYSLVRRVEIIVFSVVFCCSRLIIFLKDFCLLARSFPALIERENMISLRHFMLTSVGISGLLASPAPNLRSVQERGKKKRKPKELFAMLFFGF